MFSPLTIRERATHNGVSVFGDVFFISFFFFYFFFSFFIYIFEAFEIVGVICTDDIGWLVFHGPIVSCRNRGVDAIANSMAIVHVLLRV